MKSIPVSKIVVDSNVRGLPDGISADSSFDALPESVQDGIKELAASIKTDGLLQPLVVKEMGRGTFRLVCGWRRLNALKLNGATVVAASIVKGKKQDEIFLQLIENIQRQDLSTLDIAKALKAIIAADGGMKQSDLAKRLNKSEAWISMHIRIEDSDPALKDAIGTGEIPASGARHIASLPRKDQAEVVKNIISEVKSSGEESASVSSVKKHVDSKKNKKAPVTKKEVTITKIEDRFKEQAPLLVSEFVKDQYGDTDPGKTVLAAIDLFVSFLHKKQRLVILR